MFNNLRALFNPDRYHGWGKTKTYFEGWYYKVINKKEDEALAIIPGIAMDENGNKQAFIQVLDGKRLTAEYHKFEAENFLARSDRFKIKIEENVFSSNSLKLNLPSLTGDLHFKGSVPWPSSWYSPGIMGPFSFIPMMECYHGVLSMNHKIYGELNFKGRGKVSFNEGKGYMEKDWGRSFPEAYIWIQSNHFTNINASLKASVAKIPWLKGSFVGFIAGFWLEGKLYQFTTYNFSSLEKTFADHKTVEIVFQNAKYRLEIKGIRDHSTELASPIQGFMDGRIKESMTSKVMVRLTDKRKNKELFLDEGRNAGLEIAGDIQKIIIR